MTTARTALVTGTSTGFGYLAAQSLAEAGYTVFATMRDTHGRNAEPKQKLEARGITVLELDVTSQASVDALAHTVLSRVPAIDVLVNNAGTAHMGVTEAFTAESAERQFATNYFGPIRINRAFLPAMRERKSGLIIFISSVVGRFVLPFTGIYTSSKFALEAYAESLAYELRPSNVDIALVEPGAYATNIFQALIVPDDTARVAAYGETAKIFDQMGEAMGKSAGDPQEVADAIVDLAQQPAGRRPLRTAVPAGSPAESINRAVEPIQRGVMEEFGLAALLPASPAAV